MRVINKETTVAFSTLREGDCFYHNNCLYVRTCGNHGMNCFCFEDNQIAYMCLTTLVRPVNAEVVVI